MEVGVSSIPVSEVSFYMGLHPLGYSSVNVQFYCEEHTHIGEVYARFAFCKDVDTLKAAGERLQGLKKFLSPA